ncbi:unnamed protein product [Bursaphelenchus xylophilus]|uniref:(pine wood nematode) hypothetical protein n=1 Tax=Bursaphelenchus xylophilus TaxID=6326 RepID=A0A7I8X9Q9_BURXY|nr:unnamed protein product [Bursaphelenchus xylophilus]CAG9132113.1 unnamed protein product [Bursaphelenchus xylophilus]
MRILGLCTLLFCTISLLTGYVIRLTRAPPIAEGRRAFASLLHFGEVVDLDRNNLVDFRPRRPHRFATELLPLPEAE